jgi:hypothetical protein
MNRSGIRLTRALDPGLRALLRSVDRLLRRVYGVFEWSDRSDCLLRVRLARSPRSLELIGLYAIFGGLWPLILVVG